jgi:hypothetical protein
MAPEAPKQVSSPSLIGEKIYFLPAVIEIGLH